MPRNRVSSLTPDDRGIEKIAKEDGDAPEQHEGREKRAYDESVYREDRLK